VLPDPDVAPGADVFPIKPGAAVIDRQVQVQRLLHMREVVVVGAVFAVQPVVRCALVDDVGLEPEDRGLGRDHVASVGQHQPGVGEDVRRCTPQEGDGDEADRSAPGEAGDTEMAWHGRRVPGIEGLRQRCGGVRADRNSALTWCEKDVDDVKEFRQNSAPSTQVEGPTASSASGCGAVGASESLRE